MAFVVGVALLVLYPLLAQITTWLIAPFVIREAERISGKA